MDEDAALKLTKAADLLKAAQRAETHNCAIELVNELWRRYYAAADRESNESD